MRSLYRTALRRATALFFLAATVMLAAPAPAHAQGGEPKDGAARRASLSPLARAPDPTSIRERESSMRSAEKAAARRSRPPEQARLALAQIGEDYRHIQVVNNQMLGAAAATSALDYKSISEGAREIGKRAARLKSNLVLPAPGEGPTRRWAYGHSRDATQMRAALARLDNLIMGFVMSPFFRNRDVLDARAGAKASADLDEIIELTRIIGEDAARLGKVTGKP